MAAAAIAHPASFSTAASSDAWEHKTDPSARAAQQADLDTRMAYLTDMNKNMQAAVERATANFRAKMRGEPLPAITPSTPCRWSFPCADTVELTRLPFRLKRFFWKRDWYAQLQCDDEVRRMRCKYTGDEDWHWLPYRFSELMARKLVHEVMVLQRIFWKDFTMTFTKPSDVEWPNLLPLLIRTLQDSCWPPEHRMLLQAPLPSQLPIRQLKWSLDDIVSGKVVFKP